MPNHIDDLHSLVMSASPRALDFAHRLIERRQVREYWETVQIPTPPEGRQPYEALQQFATFALPIVVIVAGFLAAGRGSLFATIPLAYLLGYLLDRRLLAAIERKYANEYALDRGRYDHVKVLSGELRVSMEAITLPLIELLNHRYERLESQARDSKQSQGRTFGYGHDQASRLLSGGAGVTSSTATDETESCRSDDYPCHQNLDFALNPSTGLPMVGGSMGVDVAGNSFGSDLYH